MTNAKMDDIFLFENFLSKEECQKYIKRAPIYTDDSWESRTIQILDDPIVERVRSFLNDHFKINLTCLDAQIQLWNEGSLSELHVHDDLNREHGDYNSLIYLNDDFDGGLFVYFNSDAQTVRGIEVKPGLLTFFNGKEIPHGVTQVKNTHRYTLIFWWKL